ncbi:FAD/NAD(P)-binding domain-containing protein [Viridothelium virens]|uniref:FAD/NAD(P)-binding domain-containing protein n=1 Tax=Viridothelium virens TaxID=1048519 RepID=A0A6A6HBN9_VIRVR|nr:FAD/NAD(P)-binding domain-containing protein [Viridothelium virens]
MVSTSCSRPKKRVAIIGGGISGISCMWELRNAGYEVHLFESESRLGGHASTAKFCGNGRAAWVDTGFITFDQQTYPKFNAFLNSLGVDTISTDMSLSVSGNDGRVEWAGTGIYNFVGKWSNLLRPWFWRLIFDILRFSLFATDILSERGSAQAQCSRDGKLESIGDYLDRHSYSRQFRDCYIVPMVAAPWCTDPDDFAVNFPASFLINFMQHHQLTEAWKKAPFWRTFKHGSQTYIQAFEASLRPNQHIHLSSRVQSVVRLPGSEICLRLDSGSQHCFDDIVLAVHANQALTILGDSATKDEREILGEFQTSRNVCVLHSDETLLPRRHSAWAAWNCLLEMPNSQAAQSFSHEKGPLRQFTHRPGKISITFDMNRLQQIPKPGERDSPGHILVSMNPIHSPRAVQSTHIYHHPVITSNSVLASKRLHLINGVSHVHFAGAWMGYGFHEDGFSAGAKVAQSILDGSMVGEEEIVYGNELAIRRENQSIWSLIARFMVGLIQEIIVAVEDF